ncbi:MAG TPA: QueG-associated DUF1730 domain-containing protein, partial [Candidatus Acidoferrum sp.]|nr:QueG-associated DUF1730 domain-containing protein [Candidatus Acidoferrum sp.]
MKEPIRQRAMELGFDDCRFASAAAPDAARQFQNWVAEGKFGEMAWMEKNAAKRMEPQKVLPDAKTAVCLAVSYDSGDKQQEPGGKTFSGTIARYARFDDYHNVLGERLKLLAQFVNELGGGPTRSLWYVDTGPILERDFAQRAGIGFAGKHTNLISRKFGNWIFLAEIL